MKEKVYLQITSGRGPAECCRVVALVLERIVRQAQASGLKVEMVEREVGPVNRKPYGLPVRAGSMSTRQSPRSVPFTSRPG